MNTPTGNKRAPLFNSSFEFKFERGKNAGSFSGYGAVFGNVDSHGDIIERGAFSKNLKEWDAKGRFPKMLLQHGGYFGPTDDMLPVGQWTAMQEDSKGLHVEGRLFGMSTDRGALIYEGLTSGELDGLSIGYRVKRHRMGTKASDPKRWLDELDLREVSIVTWGSNDQALISSVKGSFDIRQIKSAKDFEHMLLDLGFARAFAKKATASGYKAADTLHSSKSSDSDLAQKLRAAMERYFQKD